MRLAVAEALAADLVQPSSRRPGRGRPGRRRRRLEPRACPSPPRWPTLSTRPGGAIDVGRARGGRGPGGQRRRHGRPRRPHSPSRRRRLQARVTLDAAMPRSSSGPGPTCRPRGAGSGDHLLGSRRAQTAYAAAKAEIHLAATAAQEVTQIGVQVQRRQPGRSWPSPARRRTPSTGRREDSPHPRRQRSRWPPRAPGGGRRRGELPAVGAGLVDHRRERRCGRRPDLPERPPFRLSGEGLAPVDGPGQPVIDDGHLPGAAPNAA